MHSLMRSILPSGIAALAAVLVVAPSASPARADAPQGLLETIHKHVTRTSTVTDNGDLNPYAVVVAPASAGKIQKDDVLVDNFNNLSNLQGTGTTIIDYNPSAHKTSLFAKLPQNLAQCPGGVGLTTAMTVLKSGWVIVGSTPSTDGTTKTKGAGCLIVLDSNGQLATVWTGPNINGPWGNMAVIDRGSTATLVRQHGRVRYSGAQCQGLLGAPGDDQQSDRAADRSCRSPAGSPQITSQTVIASGISARADKDVFLIGPTGLALADGTTLYVSDAVGQSDHRDPRRDDAPGQRRLPAAW